MLTATFLLVNVMFTVNFVLGNVLTSYYVRQQTGNLVCNGSDPLTYLGTVRNVVDCGSKCSLMVECQGFYFNETGGGCWCSNQTQCQTVANTVFYLKDIDECASAPCHNGATCTNLQKSFACQCTPGWTGTNCQTVCAEYLVNGANPVSDDQLSASSYWCDTYPVTIPDCLSARYARLDSTGWETGAWKPSQQDVNQWIQVDFINPMQISAIVLKGRDPVNDIQYVTSYKVSVSMDCDSWETISDGSGTPKVFEGTSGPDVTVTRELPELVVARCVRVRPVTWHDYIALRFDVLGCALVI